MSEAPEERSGQGAPGDRQRLVFCDVVPDFTGFDADGIINPLEKREHLGAYGLPAVPDRSAHPALFAAWQVAFGRALEMRKFAVSPQVLAETQYRPFPRQSGRRLRFASRFETSGNWSGAYITARDCRRFIQVWGSWVVPTIPQVQPPPLQPQFECSVWIGLDGQRLYFDSSLPQIGTVCVYPPDPGQPPAQAWVQWWHRDQTDPQPVPIPELPVAAGQRVIACLTVMGPLEVWFVIVNLDHKPGPVGVALKATSPHIPPPTGRQPIVAGSTAEWVLERPHIPGGKKLIASFPDYKHAAMKMCVAAEAETYGIPGLLAAKERALVGARYIRMYERLHHPERTRLISMATPAGHDRINFHYGGFPP